MIFIVVCFLLSSDVICTAADTVDTAISFYGRVTTDANEPVAGAYVFAEITLQADSKPENKQKMTLQTDQNGFFRIEQAAKPLKITNIRKEGYYFPKQKPAKLTFDFTKNQQNPMVFKINERKHPRQSVQKV